MNVTQSSNFLRDERIDFVGSIPFMLIHLFCLLVFVGGISWIAVAVCAVLYFVRMFGITGGYHRYFAHRSYKTSRAFQFVLAVLGASAAQKGPLWWAAHHRHHHRYSDQEDDIHSPVRRSLWWSHLGWIICKKYTPTQMDLIQDYARYPELRFLNRFPWIAPAILGVSIFCLGSFLGSAAPSLGTSGVQMLAWGFFVSTVLVYHGTFTINSLSHRFGSRRFKVDDDSRNNIWLALLTMGEGWHNNHHRYPLSERQGFYWWEIDFSHYILKVLSWFRIVWDLKRPPLVVLEEARSR